LSQEKIAERKIFVHTDYYYRAHFTISDK